MKLSRKLLAMIVLYSTVLTVNAQSYDTHVSTGVSSSSNHGQTPNWDAIVTAPPNTWTYYNDGWVETGGPSDYLDIDLAALTANMDPAKTYDVYVEYIMNQNYRNLKVIVDHDSGDTTTVTIPQKTWGSTYYRKASKILSGVSSLTNMRISMGTFANGNPITDGSMNIKSVEIVEKGACDIEPKLNCPFLESVEKLDLPESGGPKVDGVLASGIFGADGSPYFLNDFASATINGSVYGAGGGHFNVCLDQPIESTLAIVVTQNLRKDAVRDYIPKIVGEGDTCIEITPTGDFNAMKPHFFSIIVTGK